MRKAVFMGKAGDFRFFLEAMREWLTLNYGSIHHWVKESQSYGTDQVERRDLFKGAV